MNPDDHIAAAGEQGHQYHLTNATASEGGGGGSWLRALFRRGWDLTQKVAIVGAAATAAPVVAPPIILAYAASLALSVPFAAYLASLAATDHLMAALLPSSSAKPARSYSYSREDDDDVEQEFLDPFQEPSQENPVFYCCSTTDEGATREEDEDLCDANIEDTQHHVQRVVCGSVLAASLFAMHHREDVMSSRSTQDVPDICDETSQLDQETGLGYRFMIEGFGLK
ncbi:hypothetical protein E2562_001496 [Oryza meyeriana var. granulata]|uniref:Uncharacterized protein n=1 Tax=Oryza meyeriana var. granulata TaxID=110450 RepID=A0A6G1DD11_9ORYZ|nr:hypothetical protein E2562_001496 [Oryza meyeriana var. granulata]